MNTHNWTTTDDGVVHIIGTHRNARDTVTASSDCGRLLMSWSNTTGSRQFLQPNTEDHPTCLLCLGISNFGSYSPR